MNIYTALITPFDDFGNINYHLLTILLNKGRESGIKGFIIGSTTGEGSLLSSFEQKQLYNFISEYHDIWDKINFYIAICENDPQKAKTIINNYDTLNINGYLICTPYYILPTQKGIFNYYNFLANSTKKEIIIYNIPKRTGINIELSTLMNLCINKNIIGIKECNNNIKRLNFINKHIPMKLFLGNDKDFFWGLAQNVFGIISVMSNFIVNELNNPFENKKYIISVINELDKMTNPIGIKKLMRSSLIPVGYPRDPLNE